MKTIVIPINTLAEKRGGLVKAAIRKANLLSQLKDHEIVLLVLSYQKHLEEVVRTMKMEGKLNEKIDVINVIQFLNPNPPKKSKTLKIDEKKLVKIRDGKNYRFYDNGTYVRFKSINKEKKRIEFIDHYKKGRKRYLREEFDFTGHLARYVEFGNKNTPTMHRHVDKNKKCFLSIWIDEESEEWVRAIDFTTGKEYKGMSSFYIDVISKILSNYENPIIFSLFSESLKNIPEEGKNLDYIISNLDPSIKKIASLHNTHLEAPYDNKYNILDEFEDLFKNQSFDEIVVLTQQQKEDIESVFARDIKVIPNYYDFNLHQEDVERDFNRIIMISRIDKKKRVDVALDIMKILSKKDPDMYLDFYGFGYNDEYEECVFSKFEEYDLKNFNFKGFSPNIEKKLLGSGMSILTSDTEAFPLTIMESISHNVPCISFDIKYGPQNMIIPGKNGFLIEKNNLELFVDKILECKKRLGQGEFKNISNTLSDISSAKVKKQWKDLFENL